MLYSLKCKRFLPTLLLLTLVSKVSADTDVKTTSQTTPLNHLLPPTNTADANNNDTNNDDNSKNVFVTNPVDAFELPEVEVVSTTPVGATGLALKKIPGNVQSVEDEEINRHESLSVSDFMNRRMQSVNINDTQNNPYQPDITYRGFNGSPLLGTPIGISAYQDGVRINEAFGDTINWDLIPQIAISSMEMMPGSNPIFGLNTLGGAMSIKTKSGFSHPGLNAQAYGGSYARQGYQAEYGGSHGNFDWYVAGNIFQDAGWRPYSPTNVNQGFGKVGWENEKTDLDLSFTFANNTLHGVGPTPQASLQQNWSSIYTSPDVNQNALYFVTLKASHKITDALQLSGNTYERSSNLFTLNSNTNNNCSAYTALNNLPLNAATTCTDTNTSNQDPIGAFQASRANQNGTGVNLQLTSDYKIDNHENQLVIGGGYNYAKTHYTVGSQTATFNSAFYETASNGLSNDVNITGQNAYSNLFVTDTFSVFDWMHINSSVNWAQAQVRTFDSINAPTDTANYLGNNIHFQRVNPSAGLTLNPLDALKLDSFMKDFTTYFNYNEGFRAPTTVELSCASASAPCSLPNSFVADPPTLKPVVSHTLETGMRGKFSKALKWNFALYQTINSNDILFLNQTSSGQGYFANVGTTQRQGLELGLNGIVLDSLNWYISYGYVNATYQSSTSLSNGLTLSNGNAASDNVSPGSHIPSIPQNTFKFGSEYEFFHNFYFGGDLQYVSSQYARGDDQNSYPQIPGYTVVNLNGRYTLTKNIELFAMGRNIFDVHYASVAQMSNNLFNNNSISQFQGPGAPATGYAGVRIHWD
ncbi:TonB-dependent receptor [Methylomonas sp. AM2-LC]|uniref:TonB-dependent receptor n=1 Tax=Methylomonas sp. AM2-LC TaxID=3153301 RepID=UPI0032679A04